MQLTSGKIKVRVVPLGGVYTSTPTESDVDAVSGGQGARHTSPKNRWWQAIRSADHQDSVSDR